MITLKQAIIVEGKYDRIRLSAIVDAPIFETGGFRIFKDTDTILLLQKLALQRGLIIMTDSDFAGFRIRNFLNKKIQKGDIIQVYLPDVSGKEKRKPVPSKEGLLGVEGFSEKEILEALTRAGVTEIRTRVDREDKITPYDLYVLELSGKGGSQAARRDFLKKQHLPAHLSANQLLNFLNSLYTRRELYALFPTVSES